MILKANNSGVIRKRRVLLGYFLTYGLCTVPDRNGLSSQIGSGYNYRESVRLEASRILSRDANCYRIGG